jgi:gliding motility-associatede transport system auxiliary component
MKPQWRRFAPIGLYLALIAALFSIGLYVVQRQMTLALQISLGLIVIGLALYAILDPDRVRQLLTGRQARYGSNALILTLAFIGIIVVLNYLVYANPKTWDMTEDKQFTLAPETINTLNSLSQDVTAQAFFSARSSRDSAEQLLERFKQNSKGKFTYEFIDPDQNPLAAEQAKITQDGTIVLTMGGSQQPVRLATEQELTGALVRLMNPAAKTVYFLTGHGEYNPEDTGDQSYSLVKRTLESKNYTVKVLNLLAENKIPDDAATIVIAGPRQPVSQAEVDQLKQYLQKGGAVIAMLEPLPVTQFGDAPDPLADYITSDWGIELGKDIIFDLNSQQPYAPFAAAYGRHAITTPIQNTTSQFPTARSVRASASAGAGASLVELVLTSQQSWAETNLKGIADGSAKIQFDDGQDIPGPVPLAVAAENQGTKARLVVYGDSDFAIDANFSAYANGDLMVNSVDWAVGQEELISLTPKNQTTRMLVPPQQTIMNFIFLGTVIILPGLALLGGVIVFMKRRRRG